MTRRTVPDATETVTGEPTSRGRASRAVRASWPRRVTSFGAVFTILFLASYAAGVRGMFSSTDHRLGQQILDPATRVVATVTMSARIATAIAVLLWLVPLAERRVGSRLTTLVFLLGDWVSTLTVVLGAWVAAAFGSGTATHVLAHLDSGASAACYACGGAFVWSFPSGRLGNALVAALLVDLAVEAAVTHMVAEIQHPIAVIVGATAVHLAARTNRGVPCRS